MRSLNLTPAMSLSEQIIRTWEKTYHALLDFEVEWIIVLAAVREELTLCDIDAKDSASCMSTSRAIDDCTGRLCAVVAVINIIAVLKGDAHIESQDIGRAFIATERMINKLRGSL